MFTQWAYSPFRVLIMLLRSHTSYPEGVSSSLSRFFAHAVVSYLCAVGSAYTCRLFSSLSQRVLLASDQRLLSEWLRLLMECCTCSEIGFPPIGKEIELLRR